MEHVIDSSSDFIWHLCQGGRGIGLLRRSPSTPKPAAASWRRRNPVQHVSAREAAPQVVVDTRDRAPGVIIEYGGAKSSAARAASRPLVRSAEFHWDSRYRGIMRTLDNLEASLQQDPDLDPTRELDELIEAMTRHFTRENACMDLVAFPQSTLHSLRHRNICFETAKLRYRCSKGAKMSPGELELIRLIWMEHIELHDALFERFLAS